MNNGDGDKKKYGIWIPGKGWLRGADVFADHDYQKALQVSRLIGQNSKVRFIDKSIVDLEHQYLEQESRSLWRKLREYLTRMLARKDLKEK